MDSSEERPKHHNLMVGVGKSSRTKRAKGMGDVKDPLQMKQ